MARREKVYNEQDVRLFNIGPGQIIGFNDVIDQRRYSSFVKCISSSGTVYVIKSEEFNVKMRKDSRTWNFLLKEARDRDQQIMDKFRIALINLKETTKALPDNLKNPPKKDDDEGQDELAAEEEFSQAFKESVGQKYDDTFKSYVQIMNRNNVKISKQRIADFRATLDVLVRK